MISNEKLIKSGCKYFFNTPSQTAKTLFFYPTIVGDFYYLNGYLKNRSSFDSFLFLFIENGCLKINTNGKEFTAKAGSIVFLDCYLPHEYRAIQDTHVLWFHFDGNMARNYYQQIIDKTDNVIYPHNPVLMRQYFENIYESFLSEDQRDEAVLSLEITGLMTSLLKENKSKLKSSQEPLRLAAKYINDHFTNEISLDDLSALTALSPYYFVRAFKKEIGVSPHQYLIETRISYAKYYLSSTEGSISDIAYASGFKDESAFCYTFRKRVGMTPKEYRKLSADGIS